MNLRFSLVVALLAATVVGGCRCDGDVNRIRPRLGVAPVQLGYGKVKVGDSAVQSVRLSAQANTAVTITSVSLREGTAPGGAAAFELVEPPSSVPALSDSQFSIRFKPTALQAYEADLVIASDDEDHPEIVIPINGEGAHPLMAVTPDCQAMRGCRGTATVDPAAIDFGEEPFQRAVQLPSNELPTVTIINEGEVELVVTKIAIEGPDAAAFKVEGNVALPGGGAEDMVFAAGEGVNLPIRFKPSSEQQLAYSAQVVIEGDDPQKPQVTVALTGALGPNLAPTVCANIVSVTPPGEAQVRYDSRAQWDLVVTPPPGGYDFTQTRDIRPRSEVRFSAISDSANDRACTSDPEDRRQGLTYQWTVTKVPPGATNVALTGATTATATLLPQSLLATGEYEVTLTVADMQGHATSVPLKFVAVLKQDLVVELSWNADSGAFANVDLDLHLVRPSSTSPTDDFKGAFSYFEEGPNQKTSGDINGLSRNEQIANASLGFDFNWGGVGVADDPTLNYDDQGTIARIENISLNYPENDAACATADCTYKVFVHYYEDRRNAGSSLDNCNVTGTPGCRDGEACSCTASGERCVAAEAPAGSAATGVGKCFRAPTPVVQIFLKASAIPAAVIPLDSLMPPDELAIGAPCQLLYVADIVWPQKGSVTDGGTSVDGGAAPQPQVVVKGADADGRITQPQLSRFGIRKANSLTCEKNISFGTTNWYAEEPL